MPQEFAAPLTDNALLSISGDDATAFLHGQFTNDVESLAVGAGQWNGWCSPKGRLLATFLLVRRAEGFLMMLPAELAPAIAKRLAMFVLRSKVTIRDATASHALWGVAGAGAVQAARKAADLVVPIDATRALAIAAAGATLDGVPAGTTDDWALAMIHAGIPVITAATQDAFVPQMANFELVGGVSFRKGCYPGQEIVARTQYRGILKRRMARAHVEVDAAPACSVPPPSTASLSSTSASLPFADAAALTTIPAGCAGSYE